MFDDYSSIPLFIIYIHGALLIAFILWSLISEAARSDPVKRKKLVVLIACMIIGGIAITAGIDYFHVSEKLFPSFYENERIRQELIEPRSPFNPSDFNQPFDN